MSPRKSSENRGRIRPKKSLGQHFLVDPHIIHKIISCADCRACDVVLEIGPGRGALTLPLAGKAGQVIAVEKDGQLIGLLKKELLRRGIENVILVHSDILKWDFHEIIPCVSPKIRVIGNLPYNISTPFLYKLIENRARVSRAVLMFQSEIGRRLTASPGNRIYGAITVLVQYHAHATVLLEVSKNAFFPKPKVDSMVLELDFERPYGGRAIDETNFRKVVKGAFAYRRKTLLNSLNGAYPSLGHEALLSGIQKCGIDPERRAEALDINDFIHLASSLELTIRCSQ